MGNYTPNSLLKVASEMPFMYQVKTRLLEDGMLNISEIGTFYFVLFSNQQ